MTEQEIRDRAPSGAMFYCEYPITCYDRPKTYLKVKWKMLFGWNCTMNKWVFVAFPFRKGDEIGNDYLILKTL